MIGWVTLLRPTYPNLGPLSRLDTVERMDVSKLSRLPGCAGNQKASVNAILAPCACERNGTSRASQTHVRCVAFVMTIERKLAEALAMGVGGHQRYGKHTG